MKIYSEEIEGSKYTDIVLSQSEINKLRSGEMVQGVQHEGLHRNYVGLRVDDRYMENEKFWWEKQETEEDF